MCKKTFVCVYVCVDVCVSVCAWLCLCMEASESAKRKCEKELVHPPSVDMVEAVNTFL